MNEVNMTDVGQDYYQGNTDFFEMPAVIVSNQPDFGGRYGFTPNGVN